MRLQARMKNKLKQFSNEEKIRIGNMTAWKKIFLFIDCFLEREVHKVPMDEYFKYEFYLKNRRGREEFATECKRREFYKVFNDADERKWFDDKSLFHIKFKDFMKRDEINLTTASEDEFTMFTTKHKKIFLKPLQGYYGIGSDILEIDDNTNITALFKQYRGQSMVAEEFIKQDFNLSKFNDSSVNTIRIMTFVKQDGNVDVVPYAAFRIGRKNKTSDNFHNDGIAAMIDSKTGVIITTGVDKNGNRWAFHPDSGEQIIGFHIPNWEKVCECVKRAALVCPNVRFVGWDVSITDKGDAILVEGNSHPDPDVIQVEDGIGKWYLYANYLNKESGGGQNIIK